MPIEDLYKKYIEPKLQEEEIPSEVRLKYKSVNGNYKKYFLVALIPGLIIIVLYLLK